MSDKDNSLIPPYMNFKYTEPFVKDKGNGRRFHRCIGASFGNLHVYDSRQADQPITQPYRLGDHVVESVLFREAYPGPYMNFEACWFSDVFAIDDMAIQYDPDKDATIIHDKPKIKEQLDCYLERYVQPLSSNIMFFQPRIRFSHMKPTKLIKKAGVDKDSQDYPFFQVIQQMNFDPNPKLTANRFFTPYRYDCDTSILFKIAPDVYKLVSIQRSGMHIHVDRIEYVKNTPKPTSTYEDARDGMRGLEMLLSQIKQERDKYVQEQYYIHQ